MSAESTGCTMKKSTNEVPLEAFPPWLGEYLGHVAASLQVPHEMVTAIGLGLLAVVAARLGCINPFNDHEEPLNLFVALVAPPGQKKSAVFKAFFAPLYAFEREMVQRGAPERRRAARERAKLERELDGAKNEGDEHRLAELDEQLAAMAHCVEPKLTTSDVTAQKLASLLVEYKQMAVVSAEPNFIQTVLGRWANGRATTEMEVFLQGHAGDAIKVDRQGRPSQAVENPRLSLVVGLQPEALKSLSGAETVGRGLLARFLIVNAPDVRGTSSLRAAKAVPKAVSTVFEQGLRAMLEAKALTSPIVLSQKAQARWVDFHDGFESRLRSDGDMRDMHGWGEKYRGHVARIAGILHLAEGRGAQALQTETLDRAILLGNWLIPHAQQAFIDMRLVREVRVANDILEVVRREEWHSFSKRQLHQKVKDRNAYRKVKDVELGIDALIRKSWLTQRVSPEPSVGRPTLLFDVHPDVHSEGFEGLSGGLL
jgi:replicative DNA helicase